MASDGGGMVLYVALLFAITGSCGRLVNPKPLEGRRGNSTAHQGRVADRHTHHGRLEIGQNSLTLKGSKLRKRLAAVDDGYRADRGWMQTPEGGARFSEQRQDDVSVEQILKMEPKVECSAHSMKLEVQSSDATPGSLFLIDRGRRLSPLSLSKLPSSCGYTVKSTHQGLVVVAPYDGCFVALEEDNYVLPMLWLGLPVRMLCPQVKRCLGDPPMVTCYSQGMVVKMDWPLSDIKVNVSGNWEPLVKASHRCGFGMVEHSEGVVVSMDYRFCLQKNDGMYTLEMYGDGKSIVSCPSMSDVQLELTDDASTGGYEDLLHPKPVSEKPFTPVFDNSWGNVNQQYPPRLPENPSVDQPGAEGGGGHQPSDPSQPQPGRTAVWPLGGPHGSGYPLVYPPYPLQPGEKPAAPTGQVNPPVYPSYPFPTQNPVVPLWEGQWKPIYYPDQNYNNPATNPMTWPPSSETTLQQGHNRPGDGQVPPSPLNVPSFYCACPSGFGNCCPQVSFHQHHHHILPVPSGSGEVPPIYSGLPFVPIAAFPGLDDGSGSPASQNPNDPTSRPYFQPPEGSLGAIPGGLPASPEQANVYVDPRVVGQYWSYPPLSESQASGRKPVNPIAHHHPYMVQPPNEHRSLPGNMNYATAPQFFSPVLQQHVAKQQPKPASQVRSRPPYVMLQDSQVPAQNVSAHRRSPPASRVADEHVRPVNASSESERYALLKSGPPGEVPHLFEAPFGLTLPGRNRGHSDKSPEDLNPSKEKTEHRQRLKGTPTSFPNFWTRTISKRKIPSPPLQKAFQGKD